MLTEAVAALTPVTETRSKLANAVKSNGPNDPKTIEARRNHAAAKLERYIAEVVSAAPPLTADQKARLVRALA